MRCDISKYVFVVLMKVMSVERQAVVDFMLRECEMN